MLTEGFGVAAYRERLRPAEQQEKRWHPNEQDRAAAGPHPPGREVAAGGGWANRRYGKETFRAFQVLEGAGLGGAWAFCISRWV